MKKWLTIAVIAGLLTGCSSALPDAEYTDLVRETPSYANYDDATIRDLGQMTCDAFKEGNDYPTVLKVLLDGDIPAGDAGAFIAYSLSQYCPGELDKIPG